MTDDEALAIMKKRCDSFGLHEEVREEYDANRKSGLAPASALWCAFYEWDL